MNNSSQTLNLFKKFNYNLFVVATHDRHFGAKGTDPSL